MNRFGAHSLLALALAACAASAQAVCGMLDDPNSAACMAARAPAPAAAATGNPALEKGRGQTVCAFVDQKTQRCLTMRPNTKQYDSAVRTGVEAAMMGMQIMADGREEARRMGIAGFEESATASGAGSAYNSCINDGLARIADAQHTRASPEQVSLVLKGCAR